MNIDLFLTKKLAQSIGKFAYHNALIQRFYNSFLFFTNFDMFYIVMENINTSNPFIYIDILFNLKDIVSDFFDLINLTIVNKLFKIVFHDKILTVATKDLPNVIHDKNNNLIGMVFLLPKRYETGIFERVFWLSNRGILQNIHIHISTEVCYLRSKHKKKILMKEFSFKNYRFYLDIISRLNNIKRLKITFQKYLSKKKFAQLHSNFFWRLSPEILELELTYCDKFRTRNIAHIVRLSSLSLIYTTESKAPNLNKLFRIFSNLKKIYIVNRDIHISIEITKYDF